MKARLLDTLARLVLVLAAVSLAIFAILTPIVLPESRVVMATLAICGLIYWAVDRSKLKAMKRADCVAIAGKSLARRSEN